MYEIKKNIPIPSPRRSNSFEKKYPYKNMEIGDSFDVDVDVGVEGSRNFGQSYAAKKYGYKIAQRHLEVEGKNILRIWRTA